MKLHQAQAEAAAVLGALTPFCERISAAGSVRRLEPEVRDVEVVCVPDLQFYRDFQAAVNAWPRIKGEAGGKYTRRRLPSGAELDLFVCSLVTWPVNLMIRTGCAAFSQAMVTRAKVLGMPCRDARLHGRDGRALKLATEEEVFAALQVPYVKPHHRSPDLAERLRRLPFREAAHAG